ncbi:uncharacterized protein MYCGRDRAFT_73600 [Zymoseptoria tritici IPO323]|uniref:R3H domain-containing protein n=1 Tax=Zymoseptoria tritici (strain CBS 115943 / IPO323) TaxID=336722 RepID=F9XG60_ZYMTI|nr:uncharacterized protein MYCGRDRAFT_73600 [Zymoseptoria tritici IPO323]EGP86295.1 hypothetical protein MYCGRDRAFT_73600 [Zymoseptoria tritici IPO323]
MEAPIFAQPASQVANQDSTATPRRRPNRGRGRGRGGDNAALAFRPASIAPLPSRSQPTETHTQTAAPQPASVSASRARGGRRGRGGAARPNQPRTTVNGRAFGGGLTQDAADSSDTASLHGSAPAFVPGQQHTQHNDQVPKQPRRQRLLKKVAAPKSQAPDIATRTHEDIDHGHYECAICTSEVQRNSKVWSCHTCWTVFHLTCIKKWSSNEGSTASRPNAENGDTQPGRQWRCPGCNLPKDVLPQSYSCWCEKEYNPPSLAGLHPHSCGQTCGRERVRKCPHPCQLTCHAGPCPPCTHMGPTQSCFCGKHESTKRCAETEYTGGWGCGEICGALMSCGVHYCAQACHEGSCGACEVRLPARCYCGQMEKDVLCSDQGEVRESLRSHDSDTGEVVLEAWTGVFDCGNSCDRTFDCGVHKCEKRCHPQEPESGHCPHSPDVVTHCPCGKTSLTDITSSPRDSCQDPIPSCVKPCDQPLACGHPCPRVCHFGNCPPCRMQVEISCRCGRTTSVSLCHQGHEESPQCRRVCRANLNCGRHACEERCCAGERRAIERQAGRKKQRPLASAARPVDDGFEAEHICTRQCGRMLKCGNHVCEELCHKGPCGSCREAIFEEISCHCGRTVLQPPLPCGTVPPPCRYACERPKACGHPQVPHNCHQNEEACPKCPYLCEKRCMCSKKIIKNTPCWLRDVGCGEVCGKLLKCGSHYCRKPCHRAGSCEDANGQPCVQPCGKEKKICGHSDEAQCHAPSACKEETPCPSKMFITCACQAQKQEIKCGASKSTEGNGGKVLPCNDECARLERNRKLAVALNIDQATHVDGGDHIPFSSETLNYFAQHTKWGQTQEREFRVFAAADDEKRLRFKPMQAAQRQFIHLLAEDFGLDTESIDPEPHRHVMVWKTPRFVSAPNKTLADALRIRQAAQRSINTSANSKVQHQPFNGFVISKPRFGLTIDDVRSEVNAVTPGTAPFTFDIEFLPSEEVVLKAISRALSPQDLERSLQSLRNTLGTAIAGKGIGSMQLCTTDNSLNITRLESDNSGGDGWSRVAAKKAAPRVALQNPSFGASNSFAALTGATGKVTFAKKTAKVEKKKKKDVEMVVDDWEAAEMAEEEKEDGGGKSDAELKDVGGRVEETAKELPEEANIAEVEPESMAKDTDVQRDVQPEAKTGHGDSEETEQTSDSSAVPVIASGPSTEPAQNEANAERLDWVSEVDGSVPST